MDTKCFPMKGKRVTNPSHPQTSGNFIEAYDDIAVDVVSDTRSNMDMSLSFTNREIAANICMLLNVETFDLFAPLDFEGVCARNQQSECLAFGMMAFLRWRVFTAAITQNKGDMGFSLQASAHSEYWYHKLIARQASHIPNAPKQKHWLQ